MQVVINISDNLYSNLKNGCGIYPYRLVYEAIINGIPLPKGHGELKDIDKIIKDGTSKGFCDWYDEMKYADTIIEADKEVK